MSFKKPKWDNVQWLAVSVIYTMALAGVLLMPTHPDPYGSWWRAMINNAMHVPLFLGLTFLWLETVNADRMKKYMIPTVFVLVMIFGVLLEFCQSFAPGRMPSASDVILNSCGSVLGILVFLRTA